ncbi:MAG: PIG-L family deacetylase [Alphaproteobacteria bacterium]|nr:PIG-L family deacetylase [Alphaproteobacteria bacterium]
MNVLAIGAHFDDIEIGCGGTIAKHVRNGDRVFGLIVTNSEYHNLDGTLRRTREVARKEGYEAARILGIELIEIGLSTREVTFCPHLIDLLERNIIEKSIDVIYTHWDNDVHQDHQSIGKATMAAGRKVNRIFMYRSNLYQTTFQFSGNYFVDISDFLEMKIESIREHKTEVDKFGPEWLSFWRHEASNNGQRCGTKYAEVFQLVKFLA